MSQLFASGGQSISIRFLFQSDVFDIIEAIYTCVCVCVCVAIKLCFLKDRYFVLKNMGLNVKIIAERAKSPDSLMLETSGRI